MLNRLRLQRGFTLIELMVTLSIFAFLLLMGGPSFSEWMQNSKLRSTAESILAGLQLAKSEAVSRNTLVRFQLTSTMDDSCVLSATSANWIVNPDVAATVVGKCATDPAAPDALVTPAEPFIIQKHEATNLPVGITVAAGATSVVFNGLGRPTSAGGFVVNVTNLTAGLCAKDGGPVTCLQVAVSPAGQVRMCNTKFLLPDPQGC